MGVFFSSTEDERTLQLGELSNQRFHALMENSRMLRHWGTEPPFTGKYLKHKGEGVYTCAICRAKLFSSEAKYDCGSGWLSFCEALESSVESTNTDPDDETTDAILRHRHVQHGMVWTKIECKKCTCPLGYLFDDGGAQSPTGARFSVQSAALGFQPKKFSETLFFAEMRNMFGRWWCFKDDGGKSSKSKRVSVPTSIGKIPPEVARKLTKEDWAKRLPRDRYFVTREGATEPEHTGESFRERKNGLGLYTCVCCGAELFSSKARYFARSGWPSFSKALEAPVKGGSGYGVLLRKDVSEGMLRMEVICRNCDAHLGHVFDDGPKPTGERFTINSLAIKLEPMKKKQSG